MLAIEESNPQSCAAAPSFCLGTPQTDPVTMTMPDMASVIDLWQLLTLSSLLLIIYTLYGVVYRLYLSPIAKFPGPKLAGLTLWYEFYYDVVKRGQYTFKIRELHKQYGTIYFCILNSWSLSALPLR